MYEQNIKWTFKKIWKRWMKSDLSTTKRTLFLDSWSVLKMKPLMLWYSRGSKRSSPPPERSSPSTWRFSPGDWNQVVRLSLKRLYLPTCVTSSYTFHSIWMCHRLCHHIDTFHCILGYSLHSRDFYRWLVRARSVLLSLHLFVWNRVSPGYLRIHCVGQAGLALTKFPLPLPPKG